MCVCKVSFMPKEILCSIFPSTIFLGREKISMFCTQLQKSTCIINNATYCTVFSASSIVTAVILTNFYCYKIQQDGTTFKP